jgi:hypothetical protein
VDGSPPIAAPATPVQRLDLLLEVTRRLVSQTDLEALLLLIAEATTQLVDAERATIYLVDHDRGEVWSKIALEAGEIRLPLGKGLAGTVASTGETINLGDAYRDPRFDGATDFRSGYRTRTLLTAPMRGRADGRVIGVFQVLNKRDGRFTVDDEEMLAALAASASIAVENAQLIAEQKRLWQSLIETLAVTIDARDQQTAGHSQRVTRYAEIIGRQMGLTPPELERLRAAALLHDYGKIGVRDKFLQKPGKLTDAEFEYMRAHAQKTGAFLSFIAFPRDMWDVPVMAAQHHERMDGRGYPRGIPGARIHLGARVIAAADVFDALTAPRYYKGAYSIETALEMIDSMAGAHLDEAVVRALHAALPLLRAAVNDLKWTWPRPGEGGMGSIEEAADGGLSERDRAAGSSGEDRAGPNPAPGDS